MIGVMSEELFRSSALLHRLSEGDERAFEQVFHACYGPVYGAAYRLLGNRAEAEEAAQEAFLRLHRQPPTRSSTPNLMGWLITVATNLAYNRLRSERRRRQREEQVTLPAQPMDAADETDVGGERARRVRRVLAQLPERQTLILLLRHSGLSYSEVAEQLGVAPGSVGTLLARAERAFRRAYEECEHEDGDPEQA